MRLADSGVRFECKHCGSTRKRNFASGSDVCFRPIADIPVPDYIKRMDEIEPPLWTLREHLTAGGIALARIEADRANVDPEPVCHHFCEADPVDPMAASVEATYRYLSPVLQL